MAEELKKLRSKFVQKVSKDIVKQLLDLLLEDKVINDGEKESIMEENLTTSDKARQTIDTVSKKGDNASNRLLQHLQKCDPTLYEDLCPEVRSQKSEVQQAWSSTLIKSKEAFWKEKQNDKNIYPVTLHSSKNRVALLITNINFVNKKNNRAGAEKDEENMEKLLTDLGYEVVKHTDLTGKQMDAALAKFSTHPKLKKTDSVFVVIMSHGKRGAVLGVNFKSGPSGEEPDELPIDNIFKYLNAKNCPELVNKPKIIIIQACRGEESGSVTVHDSLEADDGSAMGGNIEEDKLQVIHKEKDFIALLSCTPDTVSYRHRSEGSFLIQFTVKVFNTFAHNCHTEELFRKVMQEFEELNCLKQMPTKDRCTLIHHFYLFPGLSHMS
ncbi:caspase a-like isoform X2 [Boleophthalmus pectinirostris]|uniref:caspase a-like isoform X2 n=1 Tax=Boleophthalmus pectinirostris TaxID=150288 RepID=UPI00242B261D|nr:caspase a-like isoform X2 [Boleophthalmus pectinirostris]